MKPSRRVAQLPSKPLMLFDGACHFCRRWIERWREATGDAVEYASSQEAGEKFPEIPATEFARAVQLIETDGTVYHGAEAVFRSLGYSRGGRWLAWAHAHLSGFAGGAGVGYSFVARNRSLFSAITRALWGADVRRPTYFAARRGFLRTLGLVYLFAFISIWVQVDGLMGARGIFPADEMMSLLHNGSPSTWSLFLHAPTICWWSSASGMLHALCLVGTAASALLAFGLLPLPASLICFSCYLSLIVPGGIFFSYQWDILLLETGFVAVFLAPWQWRLHRGKDAAVSRVGLFLAKFLLFKLMFMSGVVKLTSGDPSWIDLTALDYHYWTQPLPTVFAWFADQNPEWFKKACVAATLIIEIVVPFFIWAPRRPRVLAAASLIFLQICIALTGNYCFFNLLTIALCLLLIDDYSWRARAVREQPPRRPWMVNRWLAGAALILTLPINLWLLWSACKPEADAPRWIGALEEITEPFHLASGYGLFRVMTKERPEIIFEGSRDAIDWQPYEFKWKPGDVQRAPQWNAPHQPRLDWSMWFAALGSQRDRVIAERFAACLLRGEPSVIGLLAKNPFPGKPPRYLRASLYQYQFTDRAERARTGAWWQRRLSASYLPTVSLEDFQR